MKIAILFFLIFSVVLLNSAEFEITSKIKENPAHLGLQMLDNEYKYDNNGELCALLIVRCGVKDINFSNSASKVAQIDKQGEYWLTMKKDARYLVLKKEGFGNYNEQFGIKLKSGSVYEMSADEKFKQAAEIPVMVTTDPSGAEIFIENVSKGRTADGKLSFTTPEGKQTIRIVLDGFETIAEEIDIQIGKQSFDYELVEEMDATVSIKSDPAGADVWIKEIKMGKTPVNAFFPAGTYEIKLQKENYETINEQITITDPTNETYKLTDIRATLTIKTHKNATVYINNDSGHKGGITNLKLTPQMLNITVEMPKAETITRSVLLEKKAVITKEYYPEVQTGTVLINVIPADALVTLNGDGGEKYNSNGKATFRDVPIGSYELTVQAEEHKTHTETFDVSADKTVRKQIILEEGSDVPDNMIFVQGGTFQMGSNDGGSDEKPVHTVTVSDFYIGKTEVTQKEWKEVMGASTSLNNPSYFKGDDLPVENVSWYDAVEFCNKKSEKEGLEKCYSGSGKNTKCDFSKNGYRLPTEAEWEYAARGGVSASLNNRNGGNKYAGSNNVKDVAWYFDNSGSKTHPVGTKQPNELGIYDLSGNVWEWCSDRYDENYYKNSPQNNPQGPSSGKSRVLRGGSWDSGDYCCRFAYRGSYDPDVYFIGFRFVRIP